MDVALRIAYIIEPLFPEPPFVLVCSQAQRSSASPAYFPGTISRTPSHLSRTFARPIACLPRRSCVSRCMYPALLLPLLLLRRLLLPLLPLLR